MAEYRFYVVTKLVSTHIRKFKIEAEDEREAKLSAYQQYTDGELGECLSETRRIPGEMTRILKDSDHES